MKQPSNRGAARVGAVWIIVVVVLFFVSMAYAYVANQAAQQARDDLAVAVEDRREALADRSAAVDAMDALTVPVGFNDTAVIGSDSDPEAVKTGIETIRTAFGLGESVNTIEATINPVLSKLSSLQKEIVTLKAEIATLESTRDQDKAGLEAAAATLQGEIDTLKKEKEDETRLLQDRVDVLEADLASMTADRNQKDDLVNSTRGDLDKSTLDLEQEKAQATSIQTNLNNQINDVVRRAETPDGAVLSVSKELGIGWINRGAKHRVSEGMVFDIRTGHPNPTRDAHKAMCEVLRVSETTSEVRIYNQADPHDPVVKDDVILNPIYDPEGEKYAVLAGRFGGTYNEAELTLMLDEVGITVQKKLDLTTNYLVVGQPMYLDENGDPLEEARQPSDLAVYKDAQAQGCKIISINDFKQYFRR